MKLLIAVICIVVLAAGCTNSDKAIFVTSTSLALLEGDTKPAGASMAYKRVEGYLGPNNADGTAPPVIASIQSEGNFFKPKIRQLYATGAAAKAASSGKDCDTPEGVDGQERKYMFFGTSTATGISVGTTSNVMNVDSFVFGFKRKELSVIPLVKKADGLNYIYPSVLASIDTTGELVDKSRKDNMALKNNQVFATGEAACHMAKLLSGEFIDRMRLSVDEQQRIKSAEVLNCYSRVRLADRPLVWSDADFMKLYHESESEAGTMLTELKKYYAEAVTDGSVVDANKLFQADSIYTTSVFVTDSDDTSRLPSLVEHSNFICGLARANN